MFFNVVLHSAFLSFLDSGVNTDVNPGIYDEFIQNHWVDVTADGVVIARGY